MQGVSTNYLRTLFLEHELAKLRRVVKRILVKNFLMEKRLVQKTLRYIICSCHLPPLHLLSSSFHVKRIPCHHVILRIQVAGVDVVLRFTEVTLPTRSGVPFLGCLVHCSTEW